jgi:hypothetical protein
MIDQTDDQPLEMSAPVEVLRIERVREEVTLPVLKEGSLFVFGDEICRVTHMVSFNKGKGDRRLLRCFCEGEL